MIDKTEYSKTYKFYQQGRKATGIGVIGLLLLVLYPTFIYFVVVTLSAYRFQEKAISNNISIPSLIRQAEELGNIRSKERKLNLHMDNLHKKLTAYEDKHDETDKLQNQGQQPINEEIWNTGLNRKKEEIKALSDRINQLETQATTLMIAKNSGDLLSELDYMRTLHVDAFAMLPAQILVLLLTLSMGALGSLLYITQDFFNPGTERPFSWYLFRPFLGMVTAISIYVLARAGQITISDAGAANGMGENLNPFFISFLAIISGLLSEHAIAKIKSSAKPFFKEDDEEGKPLPRWTVGVRQLMQSKKKGADELVQYIDQPIEDINNWLDEKEAVPAHAQSVIASWLGVSPREIFTDIKPDDR